MTSKEQSPRYLFRHRMRWILLGCAALALFCWWHEREPQYKGHSLSSWLDAYDSILSGQLTEPGWEETRGALRHFGKDGLSYFTRRLAYETPAWQLLALASMEKPPPGLRNVAAGVLAFGHNHIELRNRRAKTAALAFQLLGPYAASAVPDLERLASSSAYPGRGRRALAVLGSLGPDGLSALGRVAIKGDPGPSAEALRLITGMGTKAGPAALLLAQALGTNFSSDPGKYYTLRLAALEDSARWSNAVARRRALRSLAAYDDTGLVFSLLNDTNPAVRADATNALREIEFYGQSWSSYDYYYTFLNSNPPVRSYPAKYPGIKVPVTRAFMNKDG